MIAKPEPTGNEIVDLWHFECWEAEKVHQDAIDALQNCPADASELELNEAKNNYRQSILKMQGIYDNLPYSDIDDRTVSGVIVRIKDLSLEQAAKCILSYLHMRPKTVITEYEKRLDRYEWEVRQIVVYDDEPSMVSHHEIVGRIYIEDPADPELKLTLGYGKADGEAMIINPYLLADVWRGCVFACADLADRIADAEASKESKFANRDKVKELWRKILHKNDDQQIVKRWNDGESAPRIAEFFGYKSERNVYRRLRVLRIAYPDLVLSNKARIQYAIKRKS